ncbi:phosphatidylcholine:diacylglycerol cholinephosphotransferase 1-like [Wolffia australiana]
MIRSSKTHRQSRPLPSSSAITFLRKLRLPLIKSPLKISPSSSLQTQIADMGDSDNLIPFLLKSSSAEQTRRRHQANGVLHQEQKTHEKDSIFRLRKPFSSEYFLGLARQHPIPCFFACCVVFFMFVEYTLFMIPSDSAPFDVGFVVTKPLQRYLAERPSLNSVLAGLNTVFVGLQALYILATLVLEGRGRSTIATVFMFTCRGVLGYTTQLPLPQEFLGSGVDFPVGNVSFFLFYSGHVAAAVIASLDMRRTCRHAMAAAFDVMNVLQVLRLLATRGHYTIDLAAGVMAGVLFDELAGKYEERRR